MGRLERIELSSAGPQPAVLPLNYSRHGKLWHPQEELNLCLEIRSLLFYPLNYGGG